MFSPRSPRPGLCWYTQRSAHACATLAASEDQVSGASGGLGMGRAALRTVLCASSHACASAEGAASGAAPAPASGSPSRPSPHAQARRGAAIQRAPTGAARRRPRPFSPLRPAGVVRGGVAVVAGHFASPPGKRAAPPPAPAPAAPSVAVLPFVNMSPQKDDEYFSDGITEEVINALANVEGVRVVSRTSAFAFKGKNVSVRKIGEELLVATVLEGSVRRQGNEVRIVAQLINA